MPAPSNQLSQALERLRHEGQYLAGLLTELSAAQWALPTPAAGWTIAHQVAHLSWTDAAALAALQEPDVFAEYQQAAQANPVAFVDDAAQRGAQQDPATLLAQWQTTQDDLANALENADETMRYPWFGPSMKARSLVTARIMETWAHGQDVAIALGVTWPATAALQDIAHLGVATRIFTYRNNAMQPPSSELYVELTGPDQQQVWTWGDAQAENAVRGSAWDFALLVTQRAELPDLDLMITGDDAQTWAHIAQAFAGPPKSVVRAQQAQQYS